MQYFYNNRTRSVNERQAFVFLEALLEVADEDRLDGVVELTVDEALEASWKEEEHVRTLVLGIS